MGRKPNLSQETITRIETLHKAGFGPKAIVKQTGVSQRSVERWVRLARAAPPQTKLTQKKPPGRPRKVSRNTLSVINRQIKGQPRLSARQIKESNPQLLENVSERTVSHYICKVLHLPSRRAAKKPLLTPRHKELRVAFAKKYSALPLENIRSILWSDEATFTVTGTSSGRVRRPVNSDRYDPRYTLKTVKHPVSVMVWGAFSYYGVGKLVFLEKGVTMNGLRYLELLYDNLEDCFDECKADRFQQDGASCHTCRCVREWFHDCGINYITDWPPNSPDLNPIENIWSIMKKELRERDTSSLSKLQESLTNVWKNISVDLLHKLVDSIPNRLQEVIRRKGNVTRY